MSSVQADSSSDHTQAPMPVAGSSAVPAPVQHAPVPVATADKDVILATVKAGRCMQLVTITGINMSTS